MLLKSFKLTARYGLNGFFLILFILFIVSCQTRKTINISNQPESFIEEEGFGKLKNWPVVDMLPEISDFPDPLVMFDGTPVASPDDWREKRRPELISLFQHYMFGYDPPAPENLTYTIDAVNSNIFDGKGTLKIITLRFGLPTTPPVTVALFIPNHRSSPSPVFLGLNFMGNHTLAEFPEIPITKAWITPRYLSGDTEPKESHRGKRSSSWPLEEIIKRGYAVATLYPGEISPDYGAWKQKEIFPLTEGVHASYLRNGMTNPSRHEWGQVAAWAWGLQRVVDYLILDEDIRQDGIIVFGHSRMGKAALLAGALDERIAVVIPSQAGGSGTSPSRSSIGELNSIVNERFPMWFNDQYKEFDNQVNRLPFDQHCLISLVAPRPLLLTNATQDNWADPVGQFNMLVAATPVYELLGEEGIRTNEFPLENKLIDSRLAYFIRPGNHSMTTTEWKIWMDFCDLYIK